MKKITTLFICLCALLQVSAQYNTYQNKIWAFGHGAGVTFSTGIPYSWTTSINSDEAAASVSNSSGNLLFYTDGKKVYDRFGNVMPGGSAIVPFPTSSSSQGALIVPFIGNAQKYYVFSVESASVSPQPGRLMYSVVDMTLNGGLGAIVPLSAVAILDTPMSEKMICIPGNNCDMWVLTHKRDTTQFYAYRITSLGVNVTPVISTVGSFTGTAGSSLHPGYLNYAIGTMKCSHNRQKIVTASKRFAGSNWGIELYDFNPSTGIVSNCQVLESNPADSTYSAEFSPNNNLLYTSSTVALNQWNVSLPTTAAIIASKTLIMSSATIPAVDLRLGPDVRST